MKSLFTLARFTPTFLIFVLFFMLAWQSHAQEKVEREFKITAQEAPQNAVQAVQEVPLLKNIKWYKEIGLQDTTYEAKGKWNGNNISIEFNETGQLEDVELLVKRRSLPQEIRNRITKQLKDDGSRFKIEKIQTQYVATEDSLKTLLTQVNAGVSTFNYELIVQLKEEQLYKVYEYLFDSSGTLVKRLEVVERSSFNLQF